MKKRFAIVTALCVLAAGTTAGTASAASLSGTFKTKIGGNSRFAGTWTIKFSHGNYKVTDNGKAVVRGRYTLSGNKLTMRDSSGPAACGPTGRYTYKISGSTLKFKNKTDTTVACSGRAVVLSRTFTKV
jgi:curli biogenesis system outer membrane secretion channel CsgG